MTLRLVLVGMVAALGLSLPNRHACENWLGSARAWANSALVECDSWTPGHSARSSLQQTRAPRVCEQCRLARARLAAETSSQKASTGSSIAAPTPVHAVAKTAENGTKNKVPAVAAIGAAQLATATAVKPAACNPPDKKPKHDLAEKASPALATKVVADKAAVRKGYSDLPENVFAPSVAIAPIVASRQSDAAARTAIGGQPTRLAPPILERTADGDSAATEQLIASDDLDLGLLTELARLVDARQTEVNTAGGATLEEPECGLADDAFLCGDGLDDADLTGLSAQAAESGPPPLTSHHETGPITDAGFDYEAAMIFDQEIAAGPPPASRAPLTAELPWPVFAPDGPPETARASIALRPKLRRRPPPKRRRQAKSTRTAARIRRRQPRAPFTMCKRPCRRPPARQLAIRSSARPSS